MPKPKKRVSKGKAKIPVKARVLKKDSASTNAIKSAPIRLAGDNGANFRIRLKRK